MRLLQWLSVDLKRLFHGRGLILATLLMPIVGMLMFSSVLAPMLAIQTDLRIPYAICNMDKSKQGQRLVSMVMNSESLRETSKATRSRTSKQAISCCRRVAWACLSVSRRIFIRL